MVKIRLMRMGAKKRPYFRVVVADARSPRDGRFIENIGKYHPLDDPSLIEIDEERALHWLKTGAQPTEAVTNLLRIQGIWEKFSGEPTPAPKAPRAPRPSKKRQQAAAQAPAAEARPEAPAPEAAGAPVEESVSEAAPEPPPEENAPEENAPEENAPEENAPEENAPEAAAEGGES